MTNEQAKALEYPFPANEIEWRVLCTTKDKAKGQVAAFVDSRAIQKRLDAVLGRDNWQNHLCTVAGKDNSEPPTSAKSVFTMLTGVNGLPKATAPEVPTLSPSRVVFPTPSSVRPPCGGSGGTCTI